MYESKIPQERIENPRSVELVTAPRYFELLKKDDAAKVFETAKDCNLVHVRLSDIKNEEDLQRLADLFNERHSAGFEVGVDRVYSDHKSNVEVYQHYSAETWAAMDDSLKGYSLVEIEDSLDALGHLKDLRPLFGEIPSPKV